MAALRTWAFRYSQPYGDKRVFRPGVEEIIKERDRRGEYKSLADFTNRVKLGRDDIIALCPAGVFDRIA
jgi:DNA polymerase III alpha subunit